MVAGIENILRGAARAATYNVILQVSFRLLTFVVNALVLRYVSSELLGLVNVRLTLLYSSILFLSREAFRKACLSRSGTSLEKNWKQIINLVWCCIPVGIINGAFLGWLWVNFLELPSETFPGQYGRAVSVFILCAIAELSVEPLWLIGQEFHFIHARVLIEAAALAAKCLATIFMIVTFPETALTSFCFAQIIHTICYVFFYYFYFINYAVKQARNENINKKSDDPVQNFPLERFSDILPTMSTNSSSLTDASYRRLVFSFLKQSILKQFLTEGERYVMTIFSVLSFGQQGIYDIINNLGSLVARFVFLPIEDSYYVLFCQILVRGKQDKEKKNLETAGRILSGVLKFVSLVGLIILVFGFSYSYLALDIYGGKLLSSGEGPTLLRWYCVYVLVIAVNGITECFMFALMSKDEVDHYNRHMVFFSFVFLAASLGLTKVFGGVGFILANCINMLFRIIHSCMFIQKFFVSLYWNPLYQALPSKMVSVSLLLSFFITASSEYMFCCSSGWLYRFIHIGIGGVCLLVVLGTIYLIETDFILFLKEQWTGKLSKRKDD